MNSNHEEKANHILDLYDKVNELLKSTDNYLKDRSETEKQNIGSALDQIKSQWTSYGVQIFHFPMDMWQSAKTAFKNLPQSGNELLTNIKRLCEKITGLVYSELNNEIHSDIYIYIKNTCKKNIQFI